MLETDDLIDIDMGAQRQRAETDHALDESPCALLERTAECGTLAALGRDPGGDTFAGQVRSPGQP